MGVESAYDEFLVDDPAATEISQHTIDSSNVTDLITESCTSFSRNETPEPPSSASPSRGDRTTVMVATRMLTPNATFAVINPWSLTDQQ